MKSVSSRVAKLLIYVTKTFQDCVWYPTIPKKEVYPWPFNFYYKKTKEGVVGYGSPVGLVQIDVKSRSKNFDNWKYIVLDEKLVEYAKTSECPCFYVLVLGTRVVMYEIIPENVLFRYGRDINNIFPENQLFCVVKANESILDEWMEI